MEYLIMSKKDKISKNNTRTLQLQVRINIDKLNDIYIQHSTYNAVYGKENKILKKDYLAQLLIIGYDNMDVHLKKNK
jgi:hypothetical protein